VHTDATRSKPQVTTITAPATEVFPDRLTIVFLRWLGAGVGQARVKALAVQIWAIGALSHAARRPVVR
jgi:hypothetical protein